MLYQSAVRFTSRFAAQRCLHAFTYRPPVSRLPVRSLHSTSSQLFKARDDPTGEDAKIGVVCTPSTTTAELTVLCIAVTCRPYRRRLCQVPITLNCPGCLSVRQSWAVQMGRPSGSALSTDKRCYSWRCAGTDGRDGTPVPAVQSLSSAMVTGCPVPARVPSF